MVAHQCVVLASCRVGYVATRRWWSFVERKEARAELEEGTAQETSNALANGASGRLVGLIGTLPQLARMA